MNNNELENFLAKPANYIYHAQHDDKEFFILASTINPEIINLRQYQHLKKPHLPLHLYQYDNFIHLFKEYGCDVIPEIPYHAPMHEDPRFQLYILKNGINPHHKSFYKNIKKEHMLVAIDNASFNFCTGDSDRIFDALSQFYHDGEVLEAAYDKFGIYLEKECLIAYLEYNAEPQGIPVHNINFLLDKIGQEHHHLLSTFIKKHATENTYAFNVHINTLTENEQHYIFGLAGMMVNNIDNEHYQKGLRRHEKHQPIMKEYDLL